MPRYKEMLRGFDSRRINKLSSCSLGCSRNVEGLVFVGVVATKEHKLNERASFTAPKSVRNAYLTARIERHEFHLSSSAIDRKNATAPIPTSGRG
jgi:hypothetical protein